MSKNEIAGAVTAVVSKDRVLHLGASGWADVAAKRAMTPDALFWIASMTKPVTGAAVLMLQDEGKLSVADPVAKYLPEFAGLRTPSGKPANLTITQILTHTSGLGEATGPAARQARTLADLVPLWLAAPMQVRARRTLEVHPERHQRRRSHRRGRQRHDLRHVRPEAAVRSTGDDESRRSIRPTINGGAWLRPTRRTTRLARSNRSRRARGMATGIGRRRAMAACSRPRRTTCGSAGCSSTAARSKDAVTSARRR